MKKKIKRIILVFLSVILAYQVLSFENVEAAYYDGWSELPTWNNLTLTSGNYKVTSSKTITASNANSAIIINGKVNLYIANGVTLTVTGANGYAASGGGAGILLTSGNTLNLYGKGTLNAKGGNGSNSVSATASDGTTPGRGGNGAGGGGAGIGSYGSNGGEGGWFGNSSDGQSGVRGRDGGSAPSAGNLYVHDTIKLNATGGVGGNGGGNAVGDTGILYSSGGQAGAGGDGANIGGGGAGGGGGGSGATSPTAMGIPGADGGAGGGSAKNGQILGGIGGRAGRLGAVGKPGNPNSGTKGGAGSGATNPIIMPISGSGGNCGIGGLGGTVYVANTATVSTITSYNRNNGWGGGSTRAVMYQASLSQEGGTGGLSSVYTANGNALPGIETFPTKAGYAFNGYWSSRNGQGTQYIHADGSSTGNVWNSGNATIYAAWAPKQYTLTLAKDGVTNFSVSGATKVNDTTYTMTYGTNVTVTATPDSGKTFIAWYGNDDTYSSVNNPYSFSPPAKNLTLTATAMLGSWVEDSIEFDPSGFAQETLYSTRNITIKKDNVNTDLGSVTLENGSEVIHVSGANGVYSYTKILDSSGKIYKICVGGEDTGQTVQFNSTTGSSVTINYYSALIRTKLDGVNFHPGTIELQNSQNVNDKIAVFYDKDLGYSYYYHLSDSTTTYKVMNNGEDTGKTIRFNQKNDITIDYHTARVDIKVDNQLRDMGEITLRDSNQNIMYTMSSLEGNYKVIARDTKTYRIYLNGVDTKKEVTFNATPTTIHHYSVSYKLVTPEAAGNIPGTQIYPEGTLIKVAGYGNIVRPDYHFAGWSDGQSMYHSDNEYTVSQTTQFSDVWESDSDSQAKWSFDGGTIWHFGTLEDAVVEMNKTTTNLRVVLQKSGVLPNQTKLTIRNNQSWEIQSGVNMEVLGNSTIESNGTLTNKGTLSGNGKLINQGQVNNSEGIVTIARIEQTNGVLHGGIYGEIGGTNSKKVVIQGGRVKAVDKLNPVVLGDYSTMDGVKTENRDTVISIMGGGTVSGTPTNDQLLYNFGGLVHYDRDKNTITQTCHLYFRETVVIRDAILDPDGNTHEGLTTPKVSAYSFEKKEGKYEANEGGTVSITYAAATNGPSANAQMLVPQGANITLQASPDVSNGYQFIGWYQGIQEDADGNVIGVTGEIADAKTPRITITDIQADVPYYAVFVKTSYSLMVQTDSVTTAVIDVDSVEKASLGKAEQALVDIEYGGNLTVTPNLPADPDPNAPPKYSFLGFLKNYNDGTSEAVIQYITVPKDPSDTTNPDPEMMEVPGMLPYVTAARESFDYSLSTLTLLKGWLHYDMNGGKIPDGSTEAIEDINLVTDHNVEFTLSSVIPEKQGWTFVAWERQDLGDPNHTRYQAGETIILSGEEKDAGVLLVAVYERDRSTQYFIQPDSGDEIGYKSLDAAVEATKEPTSPVYGKKIIVFNAGPAIEQAGEIYGTLPNGYTLKSANGAKLTIAKGKTLQIGDETSSHANNHKDMSWRTGAYVEKIDFINKEGSIQYDGQHSWTKETTFILYPGKNVQLISDLNTGNIVYVELWDAENVPAIIQNSALWKKDSVVVTSDAEDGDTSDIDSTDTTFNLMGGRVRVINDSYSVYNDRIVSTLSGGYSLRVFASNEVKAMRTPLSNTALDYYDENYVLEYRTIQEAIDDASRSNVGGVGEAEKNLIWIVGNSNEKITLKGDDPEMTQNRFLDFLDKSYCNEVNFVAGMRTGSGTLLKVTPSTNVYEFAGDMEIQGVKGSAYEAGTIYQLNNFLMSGNITVEEGSYINVTSNKAWTTGEVITMTPKKDINNQIHHKQIIAKDINDSSSHFAMHPTIIKMGYDLEYTSSDQTLRVHYLGDPVEIIQDLDDVKSMVGEDAIYQLKVSYPTQINGEAVTPDEQGFTYQWYEKTGSAGSWTAINEVDHMNVVFDNGEATLTYTKKNVDITMNEKQYKCVVYNQRGAYTGIFPATRGASLQVENTPTAFIQIPETVELKETEKDLATNVEKDAQDESNMISLQTFKNDSVNSDGSTLGDKETPKGSYTIKTEPSFELTLDGLEESEKDKKLLVWVFQPDNKTKLPADKTLMTLQAGVKEKERFYLRMPLNKRVNNGVYSGVMNFTITYQKP